MKGFFYASETRIDEYENALDIACGSECDFCYCMRDGCITYTAISYLAIFKAAREKGNKTQR